MQISKEIFNFKILDLRFKIQNIKFCSLNLWLQNNKCKFTRINRYKV